MHILVWGFLSGYANFDEISQPIEPKPRGWAGIEDILQQIMKTLNDQAVNLRINKGS